MGLFSKSTVERYGPALLDRLPIGVVICRLDEVEVPSSLRLLYANAAGARFAGLDLEQAVGRRLVEVAPRVVESGLLDQFAEAVVRRQPVNFGNVRDERAPGIEVTYHLEAVPLTDQAVAIVFEDVGEREEVRQLSEAEAGRSREAARYRSLVEATAAIVWTTPPSGVFEAPPEHWLRVTGQSAAEAQGEGWLDAVHPDDQEATAAAWRTAIASRSVYEVEHRLRQSDGSYRRMAVRAAPVFGPGGELEEWVGVHTDIEEQSLAAAQLADSEARLRTLFDAIADVVLVYPIGPGGAEPFVLVNEAALETYGYTREELLRMTVADLVDPGRLNVETALAELRRTRRATFDSVHIAKGGQQIPMSTSARLIEFDGRLCVFSLCRDDTERRAFRRELSRANLGLERAVAERTAQLEAFAEDLKILHRITTAEEEGARLEAYLQAGCEMFDLPVGILSHTPFDPETGERLYEIKAVVSPASDVEAGLTIPLRDAFCDAVVASEETVDYGDATLDPVGKENPACTERGFRAFIGTPVWLDDELYGTLNFVSPEPRPNGFVPYERDLIEVMAETMGRHLRYDQAQADHTRTEGWYESVLETVQEPLALVDAAGCVVQANAAGRRLLGGHVERGSRLWPAEAAVFDVSGEPVAGEALPERAVVRTGEPIRDRLYGVRHEGQTRWYRVSATPAEPSPDSDAAAVVSVLEVTDLRRAVAARDHADALVHALLAAAPDGAMVLEAVRGDDGVVTDFVWTLVNARAAEILERAEDELVGERLLRVLPGHRDAGLFGAYVRAVCSGVPFQAVVPYPFDELDTSFRVTAAPVAGADALAVTFGETVDAEAIVVYIDEDDA